MNTHMTQQDQIGLGRSITWICPPCSVHHVHHVHRVQCPPRQRPRVGEVAWLRGEEKDEAEEEEEGMGEDAWFRGEEKDGAEEGGKGEVAWFNHSLFMSRILKLFVSDNLKLQE